MVSSRLTPVDIQRVQRDTKRKVFRVTAPMALRLFFSGQSYYICKYTDNTCFLLIVLNIDSVLIDYIIDCVHLCG